MRVCLVTSTFLPSFTGGREIHVYGLAKALIKQGIDVVIVTGDNVTNVLQHQIEGITIFRVPYIREISLKGANEEIPYRVISPQLFKIFDLVKPDIVHAHDIKHFTSDAAAIWSAISSTPFVLTVHGIYYKQSKLTKSLYLIHDLTLNLITLNVARKIIVVSRSLVKFPLTLFRHKIIYIPNAILSDYLSNEEVYNVNFRRIYGIPDDALLVITIGRLTYQKGIDLLIKAWKKIWKVAQAPKAVLVVIGPVVSQEYYKQLLKLAEGADNVIFTGKVSTTLLKSALRDADVFVLASRDEGFPTVLLEAMYYGKPIIATSVGAIPDIAHNMVNSILIKPNNIEDLAKALSVILSDDRLRRKLSINARLTGTFFCWDNLIKHIIRIYEEVLRR
ncbi:MAG: glycosyltransferase family 4 protein [Desulfurococcaceae archaeon]